MKIKSQKDFWSGLMFVVVGIGFAWGATNYSFGASARPGPGYFPFGLGILMAILGAVVLFQALTIETETGDPIGKWAWKPLVIVVGAVAAFGWLLPHMGMVIALPLLVLISAAASDEFRLREALINAVVLTIFSWLIFIKGLSLVIPLWPSFMASGG
ncbi:tripartite tricarboxylate transporter TctB family protein [Aquincola tertiaricarbonis]|uniref:Tripartite tricarboxylate transporter TctB family protein n=1 Tax=Aquincola tertiaricarbonis TaxID=391953 RepID=A0ABY4SGD9_AQUTE|nr:tripartite tricarboxylate transporter TctB family protein [Aquincola tertiaricarbonis]URI11276.1 tripartite tricarboxylate transporter TctB family protein [Aquincola tertiaricarbonis]